MSMVLESDFVPYSPTYKYSPITNTLLLMSLGSFIYNKFDIVVSHKMFTWDSLEKMMEYWDPFFLEVQAVFLTIVCVGVTFSSD